MNQKYYLRIIWSWALLIYVKCICIAWEIHAELKSLSLTFDTFDPVALRKVKIVCNFGLPECNRVKRYQIK